MSFETIKDIVDFNPSRPLSKGKEFPFIDMASLPVNGRDINEVSNKVFNGGGAKFKNGDTLFARITPCLENGKTAKVENLPVGCIAHGSTEFIVLSAKSKDDEDFVYYLARLPDFRSYAISRMEGTSGRQRVSWQALAEFNLRLPEKGKRKKIGKILKSLDDKIHLNNQINQTLESIAQTIFKSWFVDFDPVRAKIAAKQEGKDPELAAMCAISGKNEEELQQMSEDDFAELQASAALFPDELVENELGEVPKGWEILDIDKTTSLIIDHRGKTPKKLGSDWSDTGITVLSAKHIKDGYIVNREQLRFVDTELYNKWMKEELEEGDILLTSEGPMGEMYYLASDEKYCLSQRLYALRANTDLISSAFLYFWLLSPYAKSDMNGRATGTTVVGIRQSELRKVKVLTPSKNICDLFNEKVKANLKQIALNNNKSVNLAQIRDTLLSKLLSGEIDVSGLQIEVA